MPWTSENAFKLNRSALDSLVKQAKVSDFAILIATNDDIVKSPARKITKKAPRDNVIFEFGLFLGAISLNRAFLLVEEGIKLPTDLNGVTLLSFTTDITKYNSLDNRCQEIINNIKNESGLGELGFVPSTALAIGYFTSYIKRLCEVLVKNKKVIYRGEDLTVKNFTLHVVLPKEIDEEGVNDFSDHFKLKHNLESASTIEQDPQKIGSSFYFKIEPREKDHNNQIEVHIYDIPNTINTILETIKIYYPSVQIGKDKDREHIEQRELKNFANVLRYFIGKNSWTRENVKILENTSI